jgi:hypothetical protein
MGAGTVEEWASYELGAPMNDSRSALYDKRREVRPRTLAQLQPWRESDAISPPSEPHRIRER